MMNAEKVTLPVEQFAARCLQVMNEASQAGGEITLTKDGLPFMRVVPVPPEPVHRTPAELYGSLAGMVTIIGDIEAPLDLEWDVEK